MLFQPTWTSLRKHMAPQWLIDAKFGIYCHWGISTLQYLPENADLSRDEALAKFTAEKFDPAEWAALFERAGARFGGPIAWHGSPFVHWDSALTDYNSMKHPPHRDIVGELADAVRARGMKFITSFHSISDNGWVEIASEAVEKYQPDLVWVDASFGGTKQSQHLKIIRQSQFLGFPDKLSGGDQPNPGAHPADVLEQLSDHLQRKFICDFFNGADARGQEVEFIYKSFDVPPGVGIRDLENGLLPDVAYDPWMTDIDMNLSPSWELHGWFYRPGVPTRSAASIVHILCDVVSKNGVLLLNVPPLADGSFLPEIVHDLETIGDWLKVNGEAIFDTSPWYLFGEGPTTIESGNYAFHHNDHFGKLAFKPDDIRFTTREKFLYATCLGDPGASLTIRALSSRYRMKPGQIKNVELLGCDMQVDWSHEDAGLVISTPAGFTLSPIANCYRISLL